MAITEDLYGQQRALTNRVFAPTKEAVDAFYSAAVEAGGTGDGEPGPRPDYGPDYYGAFVRDLDGHKIEATLFTGAS